MRDLSFAELRVRSVLVVSRMPVLKRWTNGLQCCEKPLRQTTTGWTKSWPGWKNTRKEKSDEQDDAEDRRRYPRDCDQALRCATRSRVPRPYRSENNPEMVAWSGRLDDAGLHQRGEGRRQVPLRMDEWQGRWISHHWRILGVGAL